MEVAVDEADISMTILAGVPKKYGNLTVAVDPTQEENLSLQFVKSCLIQEEQRLSDRTENSYTKASALINNLNFSYRQKGNRYRNYYKMNNHTESFCFKKKKDTNEQNQRRLFMRRRCRKRIKQKMWMMLLKSFFVYLKPILKNPLEKNQEMWIIDSGAKAHMIFDKSLLDAYTDIKPFDVLTRDRTQLKAFGKGNV